MSEIKYLGHAGFQINSGNDIFVIDPWLTKNGAFDYSWFQYPCNHHLWDEVISDIENAENAFIYVTHEHKDHLDLDFINAIKNKNIKLIFPKYRSNILRDSFARYSNLDKVEIDEVKEYQFNNFKVRIFVDDTELTRDSAIAIESMGFVFLNINDCKVHDRSDEIKSYYSKINTFAAQFSGATWHPVCYDIDEKVKADISNKKKIGKFSSVAQAIKSFDPDTFIPSAGPPCFLDPDLYYINFLETSTFPRNEEFISYLNKEIFFKNLFIPNMMPGDVLSQLESKLSFLTDKRVDETDFKQYLETYSSRYEPYFKRRNEELTLNPNEIQRDLRRELIKKVKGMNFSLKTPDPLFMSFHEYPEMLTKVDFSKRKVTLVNSVDVSDYYHVSSPISSYYQILKTDSTWADFTLSFRSKIHREPDVYSTVIQGFIISEVEDVGWFCSKLMELEGSNERIMIEVGGRRFSIDRYCPHLGADLKGAEVKDERFLVCPRHRWEFDLECDGDCSTSTNSSIHSIEMDEN